MLAESFFRWDGVNLLTVRCVDSVAGFAALREPWNALLDRKNPYSIFLSHEWATQWFAAYGAGRTPYILTVQDAQEILGLLPMHAGPAKASLLPMRDLQLMANGHSPYADLLVCPKNAVAVTNALANCLRRSGSHWDLAVFPEVGAGANLAPLSKLYTESSCGIHHQRNAPFISLHGTWDTYRSRLSKRFVKVLRNNRNRVTRDANTEIELLEDPASITSALKDMFAIGENSWQGESASAVGSNPENRRFYSGLVDAFAAQGRLRLWFLKRQGERVAFEYHLVNNGIEFGLKTGFDRKLEKIGIGTFLDQSILERLFEDEGLREYDLLGDCDFYKQRWTSRTRSYYRITLYGGSWNARMAALWNLRLLPMLRQRQWLQQLRDLAAARTTARQES